jgi:anti-sigma regulatory factor (Ser/Thr protein kinase)
MPTSFLVCIAASSTSSPGKICIRVRKTARLRLHDRPVIKSSGFYKFFPTLKRRLDQQDVTHKAAGEFLHLMKTLMAKLKVRLVTAKNVCG